MAKTTYRMKSELWLYPGETANWHFVSVPKPIATKIKTTTLPKRGFGSVRVVATIGKTAWKTSIFPDKRSETYLLPIKADVRKREHLHQGDIVPLVLQVLY